MRAVAYIRVSTEDQVDNWSLGAQRAEIARYCERQGFTLVREFADEGISARTDQIAKRPALQALLAAAERREFDVAVVHSLDRWARNMSVGSTAIGRLDKAGVGLASVVENLDFTTPHGRLMRNVIGSFSEFFSDQLGGHVVKAQRERAEAGLPVGPPPFGYRREGTKAVRVEAESEAVREAFRMRANGYPYGAIAAMLNGRGHTTRRRNGNYPLKHRDRMRGGGK